MIRRFGWLAFLVTLGMALALWLVAGLPPLWAWLLAVNPLAFFSYGYDKWIAGSRPHSMRVPEVVLLGLTLCGGTLGAFLGMRLFHHKTAKASFQARFGWIVAAQAALLLAYFIWGR